MTFYHGSSVGGLTELKPFLSEHQKPYVYLSSNPVVALLYAVKPVPKPFSFYPFGFHGDKVVYSEYFENCFEELYKGHRGFLYECEKVENAENPTVIPCAYVCRAPVQVSRCIAIDDVFEKFMEYQEKGLFEIKPFQAVSERELNYAYDDLRQTIQAHHLKDDPGHPMAQFIMAHFATVWYE